jgi:hypothetical protein
MGGGDGDGCSTDPLPPHIPPHFTSPRDRLIHLAMAPVKLVPIKLDFEVENVKLRDAFTWNVNETLMTPEQFAQILVDDFDSPFAPQFGPLIAGAIRKQVAELAPAVEEDERAQGPGALEDGVLPPPPALAHLLSREGESEGEEETEAYGDIRIIIKLDLNVGSLHLRDQFEWPLFSTRGISPEDFSKILTSDLGVGGEFVPIIAHAIREQVCFARLNYDEADQPPNFRKRPLRVDGMEEEWEPEVRVLDEEEMERIFKEKERSTRRIRRQQRGRM